MKNLIAAAFLLTALGAGAASAAAINIHVGGHGHHRVCGWRHHHRYCHY